MTCLELLGLMSKQNYDQFMEIFQYKNAQGVSLLDLIPLLHSRAQDKVLFNSVLELVRGLNINIQSERNANFEVFLLQHLFPALRQCVSQIDL